jgi:hypothetical protein
LLFILSSLLKIERSPHFGGYIFLLLLW